MELVKRINAVMYIKHLNSGWECHKHILKMSAFCLIPIVISHVFSTLRSNTIPKCTGPSQDTVSKLLSPIPLPTLHIPWFLCYQNLLMNMQNSGHPILTPKRPSSLDSSFSLNPLAQ